MCPFYSRVPVELLAAAVEVEREIYCLEIESEPSIRLALNPLFVALQGHNWHL